MTVYLAQSTARQLEPAISPFIPLSLLHTIHDEPMMYCMFNHNLEITMTTDQAIELALKHANCSSSHACLYDAVRVLDAECFTPAERQQYAKQWAARSLAYSVGIFHADYQQATR